MSWARWLGHSHFTVATRSNSRPSCSGVKRGGLYHDTHAHAVPEGPRVLLEKLAARVGPLPALLEWDDHFPAPEVLGAELEAMRAALARGVARWKGEAA